MGGVLEVKGESSRRRVRVPFGTDLIVGSPFRCGRAPRPTRRRCGSRPGAAGSRSRLARPSTRAPSPAGSTSATVAGRGPRQDGKRPGHASSASAARSTSRRSRAGSRSTDAGAPVRANTVNGRVEIGMSGAEDVRADSVSGPVTIELPRGRASETSLISVSGRCECETLRGRRLLRDRANGQWADPVSSSGDDHGHRRGGLHRSRRFHRVHRAPPATTKRCGCSACRIGSSAACSRPTRASSRSSATDSCSSSTEPCSAVTTMFDVLDAFEAAAEDEMLPLWVRVGGHWGSPSRGATTSSGTTRTWRHGLSTWRRRASCSSAEALVQAGDHDGVEFSELGPVMMKGLVEPMSLFRAEAPACRRATADMPQSRRNLRRSSPGRDFVAADGFVHQLPDTDPAETREWFESLDAVVERRWHRPRPLPADPAARPRDRRATSASPPRSPRPTSTRFRPSRSRGSPATRPSSAASARTCGGTRWRWWTAPITDSTGSAVTSPPTRRPRRSTRSGFNHFFHGKDDGGHGDQVFIQGHAAPGIYARAFLEGRLTEDQLDAFRREVDGNGLLVVSASPAHAGVLGVPDRLHGPRPAERGRAGADQPVPAAPRARRHQPVEGVVLRRRRRDGRARVQGRPLDRGPREARQPDLRRELQPAAARRSGARRRQDHPRARDGVPRRGMERDQGDLGARVGCAARGRRRRRARAADERDGRR